MVRRHNAAFDAGEIKKEDVPPLLDALARFDEIFAVLNDDDGPKLKEVFDWALAEGREKDISDELRDAVRSGKLSDADIEAKIAEMETARRPRAFKTSDAIRPQLPEASSLEEFTKDGGRWHRKAS